MKRLVFLLLVFTVLLTCATAEAEKNGAALSGSRGSFSVTDAWKSDGSHTLIQEVVVDETADSAYWLIVKSPVTEFSMEKLTWDHSTFTVAEAEVLYSGEKLAAKSVIAIRGWLPEILPDVRFRAVNREGAEEIWYIATNEENGKIILFSEPEMLGITEISEGSFPDANFREYVRQFDRDGDGCLSPSETDAVDCIDVSEMEITDLKGVEVFTALRQLICYGNRLTSLDVSGNPELTDLDCQDNRLTKLVVSGNAALITLSCQDNRLASLDVSGNDQLSALWCGSNKLTSLDVTGNFALNTLNCSGNQLKKLDVTWNADLNFLDCSGNQLKTLDLSWNRALSSLDCSRNQLTSLDLNVNTVLSSLDCSGNKLTSVTLNSPSLVYLNCSGNKLKTLDISRCDVLNRLVQETSPETDEEGRFGWWKKYDWGVMEKYLFADKSVQLTTAGIYTPSFGVTMDEMIGRYNTGASSSEKPYGKLDLPQQWTVYQDYQVAWFCPDSSTSMILLLMSKDSSVSPSTSMGLDRIDICVKNQEEIGFLCSVTDRCAGLFVAEPVPADPAADLYEYYYANGLDQQGLTAHRPLDAGSRFYISFTYYASTGEYYFSIYTKEPTP